MEPELIKNNVLKTLLYYDIFSYPLKKDELFIFLPSNTLSKAEIISAVDSLSGTSQCEFAQKDGYVYVKPNEHYVDIRIEKEKHSRKMWTIAKYMTHIIKRFPFVRAVMVTGSLSKNSAGKESDIDFMVITKRGRLWISRTLLMLFKKIFLLNSYKFFCINYFISEDFTELEEKNLFTATEVVTVKSTFNTDSMKKFLESNTWVKKFFPNYKIGDPYLHSTGFKVNNRISFLQRISELLFAGKPGDYLESYFRKISMRHWEKRYSHMKEEDRKRLFKSTDRESTTHPLDMQKKILEKYNEKLREFNLSDG